MNALPLILGLLSSIVSSGGEIPTKAEFVTAYREALGRLEKQYTQIQLDGVLTESILTGKDRPSSVYRVEYRASGGMERLLEVEDPEDGADRYYGLATILTSGRSFAVRRMARDHPYLLDSLDEIPTSYIKRVKSIRTLYANAPFSCGGILLTNVINSEKFIVEGVERDQSGPGDRLRVRFNYRPNVKNQYDLTGWLLVDQSLDLRLLAYEIHKTAVVHPGMDWLASGEISYKRDESQPRLERVTMTSQMDPAKPPEFYSFDVTKISFDETLANQFGLGAFGLGELEFPVDDRSVPLSYWFFGIAIVALGSMILLRRRLADRRVP